MQPTESVMTCNTKCQLERCFCGRCWQHCATPLAHAAMERWLEADDAVFLMQLNIKPDQDIPCVLLDEPASDALFCLYALLFAQESLEAHS